MHKAIGFKLCNALVAQDVFISLVTVPTTLFSNNSSKCNYGMCHNHHLLFQRLHKAIKTYNAHLSLSCNSFVAIQNVQNNTAY